MFPFFDAIPAQVMAAPHGVGSPGYLVWQTWRNCGCSGLVVIINWQSNHELLTIYMQQ